ncbi:MAG: hypothetical protein L6R40_008223, partial [Gallowayella cf. fulva]
MAVILGRRLISIYLASLTPIVCAVSESRRSIYPPPGSSDVPGSEPTAKEIPRPRPEIYHVPKDSEEKLEGLERLAIGQVPGIAMPTVNPLKRGLADSPEILQMDPESQPVDQTSPLIRRGKTLSIGPLIVTDPEFSHDSPVVHAGDFANNLYGSSKRLYNPDLGTPSPHRTYPVELYLAETTARPLHDASLQVADPGEFLRAGVGFGSPFGHIAKETGRLRSAPVDRPVPWSKNDREYPQDLEQPVGPLRDIIQEAQPEIIRHPETRPISHGQLVVEVKDIYAGLVLVEQKCKEVDEKQSAAALERDSSRKSPLSNEQWQALIALHKTLLHEHHDFFLASQHPSASPSLRKLAGNSLRMAIEEHDLQDREIWGDVAGFWYSKAANKHPEVGRLYHHLAILARPNSLQQLSFYSRSLACVVPFINAGSSIMTLFQPVPQCEVSTQHRLRAFEVAFINIHANLFVHGKPTNELLELFKNIRTGLLDGYVGRVTTRFREQGVSIALTNIAAFFEYGALTASQTSKSIFRLCFLQVWVQKLKDREIADGKAEKALDIDEDKQKSLLDSLEQQIAHYPAEKETASSTELIQFASKLNFTVLKIVLQRPGDKNVFPLVHVTFCFIWSLTSVEKLIRYVEQGIPWAD